MKRYLSHMLLITIYTVISIYWHNHADASGFQFSGDQVTIPIRIVNNRILVDVMINGQGPDLFVLDTGCTVNSLEPELCRKLKLQEEKTVLARNPEGQVDRSKCYGLDTIAIGPMKVKKTCVLEQKTNWTGIPNLKGVIGCNSFQNLSICIDIQGSKLIVSKKPRQPRKTTSFLHLKQSPESVPLVSFSIGGKDHEFVIDTGNPGALYVKESTAAELPLHPERVQEINQYNDGSERRVHLANLKDKLLFGPNELQDVCVSWKEGVPGTNLIGMDLLKHFVMEIDFANQRVLFEPATKPPIKFPRVQGNSIGLDNNFRIVRIGSMRQTSKDEVRLGDVVIAVEGRPVKTIPKEDWDWNKIYSGKKYVILRLLRDGKEIVGKVPLQITAQAARNN